MLNNVDGEKFRKLRLTHYSVSIGKIMEAILNQWRLLYNNSAYFRLKCFVTSPPTNVSESAAVSPKKVSTKIHIVSPYIDIIKDHSFQVSDVLLNNYYSMFSYYIYNFTYMY